jgi:hypothetical protein
MILKLLLPHEHITYTATKVTVEVAPQKPIVPPVKGKPVNSKQLFDIVKRTGPNGIKFYMF